jgi:hypothetical protein
VAHSTTRTAPDRRNALIIGGVVALAVIAGTLLALVLTRTPVTGSAGPSVSPTPSPVVSETPEPSETPVATPEPSEEPADEPAPTEEPEPTEQPAPAPVDDEPNGVLPPGSAVRVIVESIKVRTGPSTENVILGTVDRGELVLISWTSLGRGFGPVVAEGFIWYPVSPLGTTELPEIGTSLPPAGSTAWAVVGNGTEDFVEPVAPRCTDGDPDLATLETMFEWERLACFGDRSITIEGVFGCGGCGGYQPGIYEPSWLASPMSYDFLTVDPEGYVGPFVLRFAPNGPERPEAGSIIRVTGHFDDAAAADCVVKPGVEKTTIDPVVENLFCREKFVVESYEVIGFDEGFPFS